MGQGGENIPSRGMSMCQVVEAKERAWHVGFVSGAGDHTGDGIVVLSDFCKQCDVFQIFKNQPPCLF